MKKHPQQFLQQLVSSSKSTMIGGSGGGAMMLRRRLLSNVGSVGSLGSGSAAGLVVDRSLGQSMRAATSGSTTAGKGGLVVGGSHHQQHHHQQQRMRRCWLNTSSSSSSSPFSATQDIDSDDDDEHHDSFLKNQIVGVNRNFGSIIKRPSKMKPYPKNMKQHLHVPGYITKPPYAGNGIIPYNPNMYDTILIHDTESIDKMFNAGQIARQVLEDVACANAKIGISTEEIDTIVHESFITTHGVYPSPLNYGEFPKSICSSINDVICHGIPDSRKLQYGDIVSFDISCYTSDGVHGDNCATIIIGDTDVDTVGEATSNKSDAVETDWRGVPIQTRFQSKDDEDMMKLSRHLVNTTRDALYAAIEECKSGNCLTQIGNTIQYYAQHNNLRTVTKYRGHGISSDFHIPPFVKHYANNDYLTLQPGMIFTIEPMLVEGKSIGGEESGNNGKNDDSNNAVHADCYEWDSDGWTVATMDCSMSAQFEHTILIREDGQLPLILTEKY